MSSDTKRTRRKTSGVPLSLTKTCCCNKSLSYLDYPCIISQTSNIYFIISVALFLSWGRSGLNKMLTRRPVRTSQWFTFINLTQKVFLYHTRKHVSGRFRIPRTIFPVFKDSRWSRVCKFNKDNGVMSHLPVVERPTSAVFKQR